MRLITGFLTLLLIGYSLSAAAQPPYDGTVYVEPDILTEDDITRFQALQFEGLASAEHFDHRADTWLPARFYRFKGWFDDGQTIRIDVNAEFRSEEAASTVAMIYAGVLGRIPQLLRRDVRQMIIHRTGDDWSANIGEITIHHGNYPHERADGALEESMIHEGVHASLDPKYENDPKWRAAQRADGEFISTYAQDAPQTEDLAESFLLYYALTIHPDRLHRDDRATIRETMPHRLRYFERKFPTRKLAN